jgi:hypothetical protein
MGSAASWLSFRPVSARSLALFFVAAEGTPCALLKVVSARSKTVVQKLSFRKSVGEWGCSTPLVRAMAGA